MTNYDKSKSFNDNVKHYLKEEYKGFTYYVKNNYIRCIRAGIESIIMVTLMVSWIFYIMKPYLDDMNNYGLGKPHYDPIVVLSIAGFVFLSLYFLLTTGWYYISKYLRKGFSKYEKPELHYKSEIER